MPFFVTQFFGALNDNVFKLSVLTLIAFHLTQNPSDNQFYQALGAGLFSLPFLLLSATAGELADKYDKVFLMRCIKSVEVLLMILGAMAIYAQNIVGMLSIIFLMGIHSAFFGPVKYSILPESLESKELLAGNAFVEAGTFMAILIGVLSGSILIPQQANLLTHGLFLASFVVIGIAVCGALSSFLIPSQNNHKNSVATINWNIFSSMNSVMRETRNFPLVFPAIIGISWFWFMGASFLTEFPAYVEYTLQAEKTVFTLFLALFTIGIALGSLLGARWLKGEISAKYVFWAILAMSLFTLDVYFQSPHELTTLPDHRISLTIFLSQFEGCRITLDFFLLAIAGGIYIVPLYTLIQKQSSAQWLSRMIAANNIMNALFMVLSAIWIAILAYFHVSVASIFLSLAVMNSVLAIYLLRLSSVSWIHQLLWIILKCFYRVEVKNGEKMSDESEVLVVFNYTSWVDYMLLALFLPHQSMLFLEQDTEELPQWLLKIFPLKVVAPYYFMGNDRATMTILPVQIDGALFLPFSALFGKVPKCWFPKITLTVYPLENLSTDSLEFCEAHISKKTKHLLFNSMPWKRDLFTALLAMKKIHGKRLVANDIQQSPVSYSDIVTRSFILGEAMAKNTARGEYVGVLLPTMVNSMICFFGLQAFGRIPAMLNFSIGARRLKATCVLANIKTVYTSYAFVTQAKIQELIETLLELNIHIVYLEDYRKTIAFVDKIHGFLRGFFARWFHPTINSELPAVVLFTSGSEGNPKGVVLSHQNLLANTYQMSTSIDVTAEDCLFNALPVFHCFGLTAGMLLPMMSGFSVFFYPTPLHYRLVPEWVAKIKATIFLATDTFLKGYAHYADLHNFKTVRCVFAGAEKVKEETIKKWENTLNTTIFEGYGVTETAPVIAVNTVKQRKIGTVGCLLPGIEYQLTPFENFNEGGRLWISGPNVMMGYLQAEKPGEIISLANEFHDTGDIAKFDELGYLTLLGRAKRFAKIGGEMVSFSAVENAIATCWPDNLHAVLSVPEDKKGEQLILLTDYSDAKREILVRYLIEQGYSELFIPKKIQILAEMPVLGSGKIDYTVLDKYLENM